MAEKPLRAFKKWLRFSWASLHHPPWDTGIPAPELVEYAASHPPGSALDLGCGSGVSALYLAQHGWQVDGVDFVPFAILRARRRLRRAGFSANLIVGQVTRLQSLPLRTPFTLALDIGCLHSLGEEQFARQYVEGLHPTLRAGASLLIYCHLASEPCRDFPQHGLTTEWVKALFGSCFRLNQVRMGKDSTRRSAWYYLEKK